MGYYTELVLKANVKRELPANVESVLRQLFNDGPEIVTEDLPNHQFFRCQRWSLIGASNSFYHVPWTSSKYQGRYIFSRSDMKNYENEIEKFIDWLSPYLDEMDGKCIGWIFGEDDDKPKLLIKGEYTYITD